MQLAELGAGFNAELVRDHLASLRVGLQGLRLPAGAVQGPHEQGPHALADRMIGEQPAQLRHDLGLPPAGQVGLDTQFQCFDPGFLEPAGLGADQRRGRHVSERPAALPQAESLVEQVGRVLALPGGQGLPALGGEPGEPIRIDVIGRDQQLVSGVPGHQDLALRITDQPAQPEDVDTDRLLARPATPPATPP